MFLQPEEQVKLIQKGANPIVDIEELQDLEHYAVIVIGDFTGRIGNPTGKVKGRGIKR